MKKAVNITMEEWLAQKAKLAAEERGLSFSAFISMIITEYLRNEK